MTISTVSFYCVHPLIIRGDEENDTLYGGDGSDRLFGDKGNDFLLGEGDADILMGGEGDDILDGGAGADKLYGNNGLACVSWGRQGQKKSNIHKILANSYERLTEADEVLVLWVHNHSF